ncbi:uncharacterized protein ACLA_097300 [Aspergillus clavatus NRRL 1]|uniref:Uncharacterized protein n=1 Tax=Aspergillus clavatus (strain ATCC 1007 / CBS 513.65 / DSM 816 / NCTC 3887 / NRRL 1 / QM 1276 / 107) TaxID=344612 RepID=A1CMK5_ASPCL|nr:uncharacterized protein ACLA_097300 [Aspergillus clavatus NRRL 1]EAW08792.1 conserved hypothetical protein [Aspergillus clavatus NRRL 1]
MTAILGKVAFHILYGDRKKKITQFLRTTTPDSVLSDLHTSLVGKGITSITPQAVFYASSIRDSPQEQPYWTKKSFQNHLARTHPDTTIPDTAINVLWTCFYFYAYHPFPLPGAGDRKLELPAFERGFILLSLQGTRLLGIVEDDFGHCWGRVEDTCSCRFRINRIFRSLSLVNCQSSSDPQVAGFDTFITDDVIDVILTIFPSHPKLHPSLEQLKPLAERLLQRRTDQYQMKVSDLATLLCLIMRLRVYQPTWDRGFHYGSFEESSPEKEEFANILAQSFCLDDDDEYLAPDSVLRALDILPNLEQWFHQLWATLFQPCTSTGIPNLETESSPDTTMAGILRAVSLFIPPFQAHKRTELARKVKLITFQKCYDSISQSLTDSLDLGHILGQIFHGDPDRRSHLVLFLGHQAQDSKRVVVGAFFPICTQNPAAKEGKEPEKICKSRIALPQLLFQLQPSFSLFRWNGEGSMSSSQAYDSATGYTGHPNCIGDLNRSKVGVEIDSVTRQATFLRGTDTANRMPGGYEEVTRKHDGAENIHEDQQERKTDFTVTRIAILNVEGGPNYDYPW